MSSRWSKAFAGVAIISLACNWWLYRQLVSLQQTSPQQVTEAEEPEMGDRELAEVQESAEASGPARDSSATGSLTQPEIPSSPEVAENSPPSTPKSAEECLESRRAEQLSKLMDPAEREQMKQDQMRSSQMMYAGAAEKLGISDAQAERLFELEAESSLEKMQQALESGTILGLYNSDSSQDNINPWIVSYEGYDVAQKWADYKQDRMMDMMLMSIAGAMATADVPLSGEQRRQYFDLQQAVQKEVAEEFMTENRLSVMPSTTEEFLLMQERSAERQEMANERLEKRAAEFLSDKQIQVLKTNNKSNLASQKMFLEQMRADPDRFSLSFEKDENGCVTGMSTSSSSG